MPGGGMFEAATRAAAARSPAEGTTLVHSLDGGGDAADSGKAGAERASPGPAAGAGQQGKFRQVGKFDNFRQDSEKEAQRMTSLAAYSAGPVATKDCYVSPNSRHIRYWDVWIVTLLLYTAFVTPYEVAFLETKLDALYFFNRLVDLTFFCDMVLNFFMPYFDVDQQQWVTKPQRIAQRYLMRWFIVDVASILPFDSVQFFSGNDDRSQLRLIRTVRLLRLMKLLRVFRASRILNRWKSALGLSNSALSLSKFGMVATFVAHWSACLWALVPTLQDPSSPTWLSRGAGADLAGVGESELYTACLYWSVMTLTTIGYGDIAPQNTMERLIAIVCMLTGGSIYAYIIGAVCGIVSNIDKATSSYLQALDNLNQYMSEIKLPNDLRLRLREYFDHCRQLHRNKYYQGLLMQMSPSLRKQVAMHCHSQWIRAVPFFNAPEEDERDEFVAALAVVLVPMAFAPLEKVVLEGEKTNKMYIIQRGLAIRQGKVLSAGDFFGEDMILTNARRAYSVRSLTYLDVYSLSKRGLRDALNAGEFANTKKRIRRAAIKLALRREMLKAAVTHGLKQGILGAIVKAPAPRTLRTVGMATIAARRASNAHEGAAAAKQPAPQRPAADFGSDSDGSGRMVRTETMGGVPLVSAAEVSREEKSAPSHRAATAGGGGGSGGRVTGLAPVKESSLGSMNVVDVDDTDAAGGGGRGRGSPGGGAFDRAIDDYVGKHQEVLAGSRRRLASSRNLMGLAAGGTASMRHRPQVRTTSTMGADQLLAEARTAIGSPDEPSDSGMFRRSTTEADDELEESYGQTMTPTGGMGEIEAITGVAAAVPTEEGTTDEATALPRAAVASLADEDAGSGSIDLFSDGPAMNPLETTSPLRAARPAPGSRAVGARPGTLPVVRTGQRRPGGAAGGRRAIGRSPLSRSAAPAPGGRPASQQGRRLRPGESPFVAGPRAAAAARRADASAAAPTSRESAASAVSGTGSGSGGGGAGWNVLSSDALSLISKTMVPALRNLERAQVNLETAVTARNTASNSLETRMMRSTEQLYAVVQALDAKSRVLNFLLALNFFVFLVAIILMASG